MGKILGALAAGVGNAAEGYSKTLLEREKADLELDKIRQADQLAGVREDKREAAADRRLTQQLTHSSTEGDKTRTQSAADALAGRTQALQLHTDSITATREMLDTKQTFDKAEREKDRTLDTERWTASNAIQKAQLAAINNQVSLVPQGDGTIMMITKDGKPKGILMDTTTGKPVVGPKDIGAGVQNMMKTNTEMIAGLNTRLKDSNLLDTEKKDIEAKIAAYYQDNQRLSGVADKVAGGAKGVDLGTPPRDGSTVERDGKMFTVKGGALIPWDPAAAATKPTVSTSAPITPPLLNSWTPEGQAALNKDSSKPLLEGGVWDSTAAADKVIRR